MKIIRSLWPLCLMALIPLSNIFYMQVNTSERGASSLATDLDAAIPFVKAFIIPYLGWYVFIFAVMFYFLLKERKLYYRTLWTLLAGLFVCYFVYYVFQTVAPRPIVTGDDGLARLVRFVYSQDGRFGAGTGDCQKHRRIARRPNLGGMRRRDHPFRYRAAARN
ncbi:hypothetical protein SK3146_00489 [Paenibacillus konkukensis]|uniref:Uncharacterized protein n=1 Tax=Paenibacillus konkukensis TaxID=2020716 RepID=A0ABY4RGH6_9BACL|nr:hypothetical protein SK3146_00489 [Paenibacillus konkukensis]